MPTAQMSTPPGSAVPQGVSKGRPSVSIQNGTDAMLALVNQEKERVTALYYESIKVLETHFKDFRTKSEAEVASLNFRQTLHAKKLEELEAALASAKRELAATQNELRRMQQENDALKAALKDSGMEYSGAGVRSNGETLESVHGLRPQDTNLALLGPDTKPVLRDDTAGLKVVEPPSFKIPGGALENHRRPTQDVGANSVFSQSQNAYFGSEGASARLSNGIQQRLVPPIPSRVLPPRNFPPSPTDSKVSTCDVIPIPIKERLT